MNNKKSMFLSSLMILLPMVAGIILWDQLPDRMPSHWGINGQVDGWSGKFFGVFGLPLMLLGFHWICALAMKLDKQNQTGSNRKVMDMILWLFPAMSVMMSAFVYASALGREIQMTTLMTVPMGLLFVAIGNYLPKCRLNSTLGIKLKWTFNNEENWNKTHRIGGITWVLCGLGVILCGLLDWLIVVPVLFAVMVLVPTVFSWQLYRKQVAAGTASEQNPAISVNPKLKWVVRILVLGILAFVAVLMLTGNVETTVNGYDLVITATYWEDVTLDIGAIQSAEYRPEGIDGSREWGYGSAKLALGTFHNEELGIYTRYTYAQVKECILLRVGQRWLVLNADSAEATEELYNTIVARLG